MYPYGLSIRPPADPDECSETFVAIGIDFGTTYSGVSWARSTLPKEVHAVSGWASEDHRNRNEIQVPTLYDIETGSWGYEITPNMTPLKWFKLLLLKEEDITKEEIHNSSQLQQARKMLSESANGITAVQVVGLYLKNIWNHTYAALSSMLDIENLPLRVAITIPAIWPAYAQSAMRKAAEIAGIMDYREIAKTTLLLVQEPEAAALASLFQRNSFPEIQKNESFVVCDAGGGTVDVISYEVVSEQPFKLEECVSGTGKLAGAFKIDQAFESYLKGKTKLKISSLKDSDYNNFILREWELGAKRSFNNSSDQFYELRPPSKAYGTMARLLNKETLVISKHEMTGFFSRSLTGIRALVGEQYKKVQEATGKPPKGDRIEKRSRIPITYWKFHRVGNPLPHKCIFDIRYSAEDVAPKRANSQVLSLCRIECEWDKPLKHWKFAGDPSRGWKKHDDLGLTMGLQGEPKWEVRVGSNRKTIDFEIEYTS
ncbi:hypothetical protein ACHAPI_006992 [Fusarium lateritium]